MILRPLAAALAPLALLLAPAAAPAVAPSAPTAAEAATLREAIRRGALIYRYDEAAWLTADALLANTPAEDLRAVKGWAIEPEGEALKVTYYGLEDDAPYAVRLFRVEGDKVVADRAPTPAERTLSPLGVRMARARMAAQAMPRPACEAKPANAVVLPPSSPEGPLSLYLLTPQVEAERYPFGGHFRADIAADGKVVAARRFAQGCGTLALESEGKGRAEALAVSDPVDAQPTEIHVFISLSTHTPLYVATLDSDRLWAVDGPTIALVRQGLGQPTATP